MTDEITGEHNVCVQVDKLKYLEKEQNGTRKEMSAVKDKLGLLEVGMVQMNSDLGGKIDRLGTKTILTWVGAAIIAVIVAVVKLNGQ